MAIVKAKEIIVDALEDLVIQQDEAPVEPSEAQAAIRILNNMMADWDARGITLGYTEVADLGDPITVPPGAIRAIKANLAIDLAPKYDIEPSAALIIRAKTGMEAVLNLTINTVESEYPSTLPQGSGNNYPGYADRTFYPDQQDTILTETGGSIALEEDTEEA